VADDFVDHYGCPFLYAECRIYYGSVLIAKGRWDEAERELTTGVDITRGTCPALYARALTRLAGLRTRQGRLEDAEQLLSHAGDAVETETEHTLSLAALWLARGDGQAASRELVRRLPELGEHREHLARALDLLVDAHLGAGDVDAAHEAGERLQTVAASADQSRVSAIAAAAQGRVSSARGDRARATSHLRAALTEWSRLDLPFEAARTRADLAVALAPDEPDAANEQARRALTAFDALGAALDADRTAAFLRARGIHARTGTRRADGLTAREQEVLQLLGSGLTNPEIAARLHVSRKTAAHHVSSILTKLDLRNRHTDGSLARCSRHRLGAQSAT
jgi:DNA-binding NarL/FixJ family response regulator